MSDDAGSHAPFGGLRRRRRQSNMAIMVGLSIILFAGVGVVAVWVLNSATFPASGGAASDQKATGGRESTYRRATTEPQVRIAGLDEFLEQTAGEPSKAAVEQTAGDGPMGRQPLAENWANDAALSAGPVWHDASKGGVHMGDLEVRVVKVCVGRPTLIVTGNNRARPKQPKLIIGVELANRSDQRQIEYSGWSQRELGDGGARLLDSADRMCPPWRYPGAKVEGRVEKAALGPGETLDDILVFQMPDSLDGPLRLELSWTAIGDKGTTGFEIPTAMIAYEADDQTGAAPQLGEAGGQEAWPDALSQGEVAQPAAADEREMGAGRREVPLRNDSEGEVDDGGPIPIPGLDGKPDKDGEDEPPPRKLDVEEPNGAADFSDGRGGGGNAFSTP